MIHYEIQPRRCGAELIRDLEYMAHLHRHAELILVLEGALSMSVQSSHRLLRPGEMAVVFPHMIHAYHPHASSLAIMLIFDTGHAGPFARKLTTLQPDDVFLPANRVHPDAALAMRRLLGGGALETGRLRGGSLEPGLVRGYLQVLLGRLLPELRLSPRPAGQSAALIERALMYLADHFSEPVTLQTAADALSVSKYHLSHVFTQKLGCGFSQYLGSLRAEYARSLLAETGKSVTEACYESGFESVSTFYRVYHKNFGAPPSAAARPAAARTPG